MSALERAEEDIKRGDYGLARQRLTSYMHTKGYDPELLAKIGRLSFDMGDLFQAGRYWFLSPAESKEAQEAIERFIKQAASDPTRIVGQLPRAALLTKIDDYPPIVAERIHRFGLGEVFEARARQATEPAGKTSFGDCAVGIGCLLLFALMVFVFGAGVVHIVLWFFGGD